jgi:hypothetical protein
MRITSQGRVWCCRGLVAAGEGFWRGSGVVSGQNGAGGALVVAQVLRQGDCGLAVTGAVDVGDDGFDLALIGAAADEDQGEADKTGCGSHFAEDCRERIHLIFLLNNYRRLVDADEEVGLQDA